MASSRSAAPAPLGVLLAGGAGRRLGGDKATVPLAGRPLAAWACDALCAVLDEVVVVAKPATALPALRGVAVWREPVEPRHPLFGLISALNRAQGRPVVVCAADLPLVSTELIAQLSVPAAAGRPAVIAADGDRLQPLVGRYDPAALDPLRSVLAADPRVSLTHAVRGLDPHVLSAPPGTLANVNTPEDLRRAGALLAAREPRVSGD